MPDSDLQAVQRRAFGATLRLIRVGAGMTQEQLALASGLDRTYLNTVESGRRNISLHAIWQLAGALHVSPRAFFPFVDPEDVPPSRTP
ncbi:helix-turn-helix domain-containing protein [Cellulomonas sp. NPDC058312]|uniref:helix-turn-helix domain-containing protein n=1 Tax=Cellulomonas sp. NPDC058312 TaxID=3346441 RepID=UPI0036F068C3